MSTALATLAGKLAERVGMDSVDPQELITTLRQTAFKGDASDAQFIALLIVANQYGLNPWTKEIYAFPDKQNGSSLWWVLMAGPVSSTKTSSLTVWILSRITNHVHAGFTVRTVTIRSALPNGWMNVAGNHSKPVMVVRLLTVAVTSQTDVATQSNDPMRPSCLRFRWHLRQG